MPRKIKYTKEILEKLIIDSFSILQILKKLNLKPSGGNHLHIKNMIKRYNLNIDHFTGKASNKGTSHKGGNTKLNPEEVLVLNRNVRREKVKLLRESLISTGMEHKCNCCGIKDFYNNKKITLEIHHIDGNFLNNKKENLTFLCPNCHSQI